MNYMAVPACIILPCTCRPAPARLQAQPPALAPATASHRHHAPADVVPRQGQHFGVGGVGSAVDGGRRVQALQGPIGLLQLHSTEALAMGSLSLAPAQRA